MGMCVPEAAQAGARQPAPPHSCDPLLRNPPAWRTRGFPNDRHPTMVPATILTAQVLPGTVPSYARQSARPQHLPSPAATVADKPFRTEFRNIL